MYEYILTNEKNIDYFLSPSSHLNLKYESNEPLTVYTRAQSFKKLIYSHKVLGYCRNRAGMELMSYSGLGLTNDRQYVTNVGCY